MYYKYILLVSALEKKESSNIYQTVTLGLVRMMATMKRIKITKTIGKLPTHKSWQWIIPAAFRWCGKAEAQTDGKLKVPIVELFFMAKTEVWIPATTATKCTT